MRYFWPLFFVLFTYLCIVFSTQNTDPTVIRFQLEWLGIAISYKPPMYLPIFLTFAAGIIFSVSYFFVYHVGLILKSKWQSQEIKRLKRQVLREREQIKTIEKQNEDLQQLTARLQNQVSLPFAENPPAALPHNEPTPLLNAEN